MFIITMIFKVIFYKNFKNIKLDATYDFYKYKNIMSIKENKLYILMYFYIKN